MSPFLFDYTHVRKIKNLSCYRKDYNINMILSIKIDDIDELICYNNYKSFEEEHFMRKALSLICIILISSMDYAFANAFGGMDPGAVNTQYTRELRTHEAITRAKQKSAIVQPKTSVNEKVYPEVVNEIKAVNFIGNKAVSNEELQVLVKNKIDKPMTIENLSAIRKDVMKYYQANGYYSVMPVIVMQDNATGEIVIQIEEGSKNSITIE